MAAKGSCKTLAVYVVGISGTMDYVSCGKSSMCHQFVYDEYMEESYSTLLQAEFDSPIINRQHTIYWGQRQKSYTYEAIKPFASDSSVTVNFEIFEHTIFHEDGTNIPYSGHENYDKRVFTPLKNFANKYAFKSRDEVLNPEEYGSQRFSYSKNIPVAYLYVMDVSQPFSIFKDQLDLMNKLVKSIQKKKHCCVVVASKFDMHSKGSVESLESHASSLKVPVIHCSAKHNTNVQAAFRNLAAKALSLKKIATDKPPKQRPVSCTLGQDDDRASPKRGRVGKSSNGVQPSAASNVPLVPLRSKTLARNYRNSFLVDDFSTRRLSLGNTLNSVKIPDQYKTLPSTSNQSAFDTYMNIPPKSSFCNSSFKMADETDYDDTILSAQHGTAKLDTSVMSVPPKPLEVVDSEDKSIQQNNSDKRSRSTTPLPPIPSDAVVSNGLKEEGIQNSSEKLDTSLMPLSPTPPVNDSKEGILQQSSENRSRSTTPLPPGLSDTLLSNGLKEESVHKDSDRSLMPLPPTPLKVIISNDSSIQQSSEKCSRGTPPLPLTPSDALILNDLKEESIQRSSEKLDRSLMPLPPTPLEVAVSNDLKEGNVQRSSARHSRSTTPLPPTPSDTSVSNALKEDSIQKSFTNLDRSAMPLPPTPLEVAVSNDLKEEIVQRSSERRSRSTTPLPPTPSDALVSNGLKEDSIQKSFKKLDRSAMPLPPTPLDVAVSNELPRESTQQSSEKCDRSTMPLPLTPLDSIISNGSIESSTPLTLSIEAGDTNIGGMKKGSTDDVQMEEYSSSSDGYERIDFDELEKSPTPLPYTTGGISTTTNGVTVTNSLGENCMITVNKEFDGIMLADSSHINGSVTDTSTLEVIPANTTVNENSLSLTEPTTDNASETTACLDEDYVISDYAFYSMQKQKQTSLTDSTVQASSSMPEYLELQDVNPALSDYVFMHKADSQGLNMASQVLTYDYAYHSYVKMCRYKLRQSGVPPRGVIREGHTPSASINPTATEKNVTYVNMKRLHNTTLLPPRSKCADNSDSSSEDHLEPTMLPRDVLRIGCYLSAPSAVPQ